MAKSAALGIGLAGGILALSLACAQGKHSEAERSPRPAPAVAPTAGAPLPVNIRPTNPPEEPAPTFELNEKERKVLQQSLAEDFAGFGKGWDTTNATKL